MKVRVLLHAVACGLYMSAAPSFVDPARAEVILEANARAAEVASTVRATPIAVRTMAIVQVSVFDAVQCIVGRYEPLIADVNAPAGASVDAAIAAATRTALLALVPDRRDVIESDYLALVGALPDGDAKTRGIEVGEQAAAAVLAARKDDGAQGPGAYRPKTSPGSYVPTTLPLLPHWGQRRPWILRTGNEVRPGPPPALDSEIWKRDIQEIASMGGRGSVRRTDEQTAVARFWETTSPAVYWPVVRSMAAGRSSDVSEGAHLLAAAAMAMDDALIAVFDAKYAYEFWRPITAIRNADPPLRDPSWEPLIETPMHPEYPCAHCIVSAAVAALLESWIGNDPSPTLATSSPTAGGAQRSWKNPAEFEREVSEARILAGVHYRNSTEVGRAMGESIGARAEQRFTRRADRLATARGAAPQDRGGSTAP